MLALKKRRSGRERRKRNAEKNKCEITVEHLECLHSILEKVEDGNPDFAMIAKGLMDEFDLQCSADFMRSVIKTKWEQWTEEKANSAAQNAKATKQSSMLAFIKPSSVTTMWIFTFQTSQKKFQGRTVSLCVQELSGSI
eukprot:EG_transcript_43814